MRSGDATSLRAQRVTVARKVSLVLLDRKEIGDRKARKALRVMQARKVSPVLLDPKEIGDRKARKAQRVMPARQHRLLSELYRAIAAALLPAQTTRFWFR